MTTTFAARVASRLMAALSPVRYSKEFSESDHPRDEAGKFSDGGQSPPARTLSNKQLSHLHYLDATKQEKTLSDTVKAYNGQEWRSELSSLSAADKSDVEQRSEKRKAEAPLSPQQKLQHAREAIAARAKEREAESDRLSDLDVDEEFQKEHGETDWVGLIKERSTARDSIVENHDVESRAKDLFSDGYDTDEIVEKMSEEMDAEEEAIQKKENISETMRRHGMDPVKHGEIRKAIAEQVDKKKEASAAAENVPSDARQRAMKKHASMQSEPAVTGTPATASGIKAGPKGHGSFAKLQDGSWGASFDGHVEVGDWHTIKTRDGRVEKKRIKEIVSAGPQYTKARFYSLRSLFEDAIRYALQGAVMRYVRSGRVTRYEFDESKVKRGGKGTKTGGQFISLHSGFVSPAGGAIHVGESAHQPGDWIHSHTISRLNVAPKNETPEATKQRLIQHAAYKESLAGRKLDRVFKHADGSALTPADEAEVKKLGIRPDLKDLTLVRNEHGELKGYGTDSKGRRQSFYPSAHTARSDAKKRERWSKFIAVRDNVVRPKYLADMRSGTGVKRESAWLAYVMDETGMRVGSEKDTGADIEATGATTLDASHVTIDGDKVSMDFVGKSAHQNHWEITDPAFAAEMSVRKAKGGKIFHATDGQYRSYMKGIAPGFKPAKDFRYAVANEHAQSIIGTMPVPKTPEEYRNSLGVVAASVATRINNTPDVAYKSYIAPEVFHTWQANLLQSHPGVSSLKPSFGKPLQTGSTPTAALPTSKPPKAPTGGKTTAKTKTMTTEAVRNALDGIVARYSLFDEAKHPRGQGGLFAEHQGGGSSKKPSDSAAHPSTPYVEYLKSMMPEIKKKEQHLRENIALIPDQKNRDKAFQNGMLEIKREYLGKFSDMESKAAREKRDASKATPSEPQSPKVPQISSEPKPKAGVAGMQMGLFGGGKPGGQQSLFNVAPPAAKKPAHPVAIKIAGRIGELLKGKDTVSPADLTIPIAPKSLPGQKAMFSLRGIVERYEGDWITIGAKDHHGGTPVQIGKGGLITSGPPSLKGEDIAKLNDKSEHPMRRVKADHAKAEGKTGRDYTMHQAVALGLANRFTQHGHARTAGKLARVPTHQVLGAMKDAHEFLKNQHGLRERAKDRARSLAGLNSGTIAKIENSHRDHSSVDGFDEVAHAVASEHPELGFDPDDTDTPGKVWDLIREGKQPVPPLHSREVADVAAEWQKPSDRPQRLKHRTTDPDDSTPF